MLAFCHIPKAAGTSVRQILRSWYGIRHYDISEGRGRYKFMEAEDIDWLQKRWPGLESIASHNLSPSRELSRGNRRVQWFTLLREPVRRYISHYQFYVNRWWGDEKIPFSEWLELDHHKNTQVTMIAGEQDLEKAKDILRNKVAVTGLQEEYHDSMMMLSSFTGKPYLPQFRKKKKNIAVSRHIQEKIYNDFSRFEQKITEANELDIKLYEFVEKELFPAQKETYLADYNPPGSNLFATELRMKTNWLISYFVRNCIRKPLRKDIFRVVGFGREL